ncbi:hypothetical protein AMK59_8411 [Oryctes borbonicus]|uniref:RNA-directed DNA polymerase n=1 Tax=Oryctes borbonicus TaxID=1629725 RepID=A0A0T6AZB2_9SCAR|nr:hypothetical protein AMK59_8411 [Oryctes borbonicus]
MSATDEELAGNPVTVEVGMDGGQSHLTVQDIVQIVACALNNDQSRNKLSNSEVAAMLPEFGGSGEEDAISWFQRVETVEEAHNVSNKIIVPILIGKFKGPVLSWYYSKPEYASLAYNDLKAKVISMFGCRENRIALMRKFDSRKWKRSEPFFSYYQDKVVLGNKLDLSESDLISYIIDGFDNGNLQAQARMARFTSLAELLDVMKSLSSSERHGMKQNNAVPSTVISEASGPKKTVKCFNCQKEGHYASACQQVKKRTCFLCHEAGHMKNECPRKKPNQHEPDSTTLLVEHELQITPAYQVSVSFGLGKVTLAAILDTGSGISLVKCKNIPDEHVKPYLHGTKFTEKCSFLQSQIEYLGYIISENGIQPNPASVAAVNNYPVPINVKQAQSFLGLASYFRKFIKNFSVIAKPLYDLLKKNRLFKFGVVEFKAMEDLKTALVAAPVLAIYSHGAETELHCDASTHGYGAILLQRQADGKLHPVMYFSKRTTDAETRYHSYELECLAIVNAIKRFDIYLKGVKFKIVTDCNSIKQTFNKKDVIPRIMRWVLFLQDFNYSLEHRSGTRMSHVDALSRVQEVFILEDNTLEQNLTYKQANDPEIRKIRVSLERQESQFYELRNGLVYRKFRDDSLFLIPQTMEHHVLTKYHDEMAIPYSYF